MIDHHLGKREPQTVIHGTMAPSDPGALSDRHPAGSACKERPIHRGVSMTTSTSLTVHQIMEILPHRPPFLLVDRIIELTDGERAVGIKQVTINEPFFAGHFPDYAVMPGVLIVEALAQVGAVVVLRLPEYRGKIAFFAGIDKVRFKRQVRPGDTLRLEVTVGRLRRGIGTGSAIATVDGQLACRGELMFAVGDPAASPSETTADTES